MDLSLKSGVFYASGPKTLTGPVMDQSEIFADLGNQAFRTMLRKRYIDLFDVDLGILLSVRVAQSNRSGQIWTLDAWARRRSRFASCPGSAEPVSRSIT